MDLKFQTTNFNRIVLGGRRIQRMKYIGVARKNVQKQNRSKNVIAKPYGVKEKKDAQSH